MHKFEAGERARRGSLIALMITTILAAGCGGGGGGGGDGSTTANSTTGLQSGPSQSPSDPAPVTPSDPAPATPSDPAPVTPGVNTPPTISATPVAQINVGAAYAFAPAAQDADGDTLAFSIENRPAWAAFNTTTGQLTGTPSAQNVGVSSNVVISVSDGKTSASLPAFSITVAQAAAVGSSDAVALSWNVPTEKDDGSMLDDLAGYRLHYGKSADALTNSVEIPGSGANQYTVQGLQSGTYYFAVSAVTQSGAQSAPSNVISSTVG